MQLNDANIRQILGHFDLPGEYSSFRPIEHGHINDTICVTFDQDGKEVRYILQRINTHVFTKPVELMENVAHVTQYLADFARAHGGD